MGVSNVPRVGVRCTYNSNFWRHLLPLIKVGQIELAFYKVEDFLSLDPKDPKKLTAPILDLGFRVDSIHMAQANVNDIGKDDGEFLPVFRRSLDLAGELGVLLLVAHPTNGKASKIGPLIDKHLAKKLKDSGITLCWETFSGRGRFIGPVETIAEFVEDRPFQAICYDTSHVGESQEKVLADIKNYGELVKVWHLSNRKGRDQHLPIFHREGVPEGVLNFRPIIKAIQRYSPDSVITLEYRKPFHSLLPIDALRVSKLVFSQARK